MSKSKKGTWGDVLKDLAAVILLVCSFRWALAEPFLVPSGSMIPTLLVKDYIFVSKISYGLRIPFTSKWLYGPVLPQRGDVVVFKSKEDSFYFMVKRVVGLPGDRIQVDRESSRLTINGEKIQFAPTDEGDEDYQVFTENLLGHKHQAQYSRQGIYAEDGEIVVPEGHIFLMGDNRDRSSDSRVWGPLPLGNLLGKAKWIWMSCKEDSPAGGVLCMGDDLRVERIGRKIK